MDVDLFFTFFIISCGHFYVPNGVFWGSSSRPHIGDLVMNLFTPFMTGDGPKMGKHDRLVNVNVPKWSKCVQKGPKWPT